MVAKLYQKLHISIEDLKTLLFDLYYNQKLSHHKIAQQLQCHTTCIEGWCRRFGFIGRDSNEQKKQITRFFKHTSLTFEHKTILDGWLLGDGHLEQSKFSARFSTGMKYRTIIEKIPQLFDTMEFSPIWESKKTGCFHIKSKSYVDLKEIAQKWYIEKKKIVPSDLDFTQKTLYYWFIGDGSVGNYSLKLSTNGFERQYTEFLRQKLNDLEIDTSLNQEGSIRIRSKSVKKFYQLIGPCMDIDYLYKWKG